MGKFENPAGAMAPYPLPPPLGAPSLVEMQSS